MSVRSVARAACNSQNLTWCVQYRYLVFLFLITCLAVIMCQYSPYAPPDHHGAVRARHG